ncbi:MAG: serine hydrolase domain-containing protein [Verrucomicrobiaceae bacterium]
MALSRRTFVAAMASMPMVSRGAAVDVTTELERIRTKYKLPALGGAYVTVDGAKLTAVTGVRKAGTQIAATKDDLWHLGSNTKAMTSTLAGIAVEAGKLRWDSTLGDVFPKAKGLKKSSLATATLTHLLTHWSGLPTNASWNPTPLNARALMKERDAVLEAAAGLKNLPAPGSMHLYSNFGYVLAGHMLEEVYDQSCEDLMQVHIFKPLGMTQAGFGGTGTPGKIDQPWPHLADGAPTPQNGPSVDNPPVLGPAGTVHAILTDWARFIAEHLAGPNGKGRLLKAETYRHLHTPVLSGGYAFGWKVLDRSWGGRVITHNGSNTMNYCVAWLSPEKGFAMIACTNQGGDIPPKALDETVGLLMQSGFAEAK